MEKNEDQFPAVAAHPHVKTVRDNLNMKQGSAEVNLGQTTSVVHSPGAHPVAHTFPHFSGKGKAKDLAPIFTAIRKANPDNK